METYLDMVSVNMTLDKFTSLNYSRFYGLFGAVRINSVLKKNRVNRSVRRANKQPVRRANKQPLRRANKQPLRRANEQPLRRANKQLIVHLCT